MAEVLQPESQAYFAPMPMRRTSPSPNFLVAASPSLAPDLQHRLPVAQHADRPAPSHASSFASSAASAHDPRIDFPDTSSTTSTPSTSFSGDSTDSEDELGFPNYGDDCSSDQSDALERPASPQTSSEDSRQTTSSSASSSSSDATPTNTPDHNHLLSFDDTALREEPVRQVDYLSHEWREQDIWSSWRYIVSKRSVYGERSRLENASWRTWAKQKYRLKTVSPETLNWLKDCDVTWLYGPLQTSKRLQSEPTSNISKSNSFLHKKPILKKRSMSEVMLQKSLSTSSLVKQAAAVVEAQEHGRGGLRSRGRPSWNGRAASDFTTSAAPSKPQSRDAPDWLSSKSTSGLQTPADGERRHIRFDEKVEQCIAVDGKDEETADEYDDDDDNHRHGKGSAGRFSALKSDDESSSEDDGVIMMKSERRKSLSRSNSRGSFSGESITIAKLPSTTLKYRTDSPDVTAQSASHSVNTNYWGKSKLSPSASQETLRPSNPSANFLVPGAGAGAGAADEESSDDDISWEPSGAFSNRIDSLEQLDRQYSKAEPSRDIAREYSDPSGGSLRRTESGMFMPFEDEEDAAVNNGLFGRVLDGVNTARDIAHVIWNVGWKGNQ